MVYKDIINIIITTSLAIIIICLWFRRTCNQEVENIATDLGRDWFLIQSHIWSNEVKSSIESFIDYMNNLLSQTDSEDRYSEIFSNVSMMDEVKTQLNSVIISYISYNDFTDVISKLTIENRKLKNYYEKMILILIGYVVWGITGYIFEISITTIASCSIIFWGAFVILNALSLTFLMKIIIHHRKYGKLDEHTRTIKSRYSTTLQRVT